MLRNIVDQRAWPRRPRPLLRPFGAMADSILGARGCLFTFHRAAPARIWETLPNREFYLDLDFLDQLLTYLGRTGWDVITLDEVLQRAARGDARDRYVNFSIDDCYRDTFEQVVPLFRRHGMPVTLFVTSGIPDGTLPLWCAGLEHILLRRDQVTVEGQVIKTDTAAAKRDAYARLAKAWDGPQAGERYAQLCRDHGFDVEAIHREHAISWDMLDALRRDPCVEIGAHGVLHLRSSSLQPHVALAEIKGGRERLAGRLGLPVRHFAFPFGRSGDCGPRDFDLVRHAGFASGATTRKGLVRPGQNAFSLPRNTLNGAWRNVALAELHLSGVTGVAAKVLGRV